MKKFFKEFRDFAVKGNMIDLAVGMIIGAAFTAVVSSLVNDVFMPLLSLLTLGFVDFSKIVFTINKVDIAVGNFLAAIVNFIAIAFVVFLLVKAINKMRDAGKKKEKPAPEGPKEIPPTCPFCLEEVKEGATRCPHCAGAFDTPAEPKPAAEADLSAQFFYSFPYIDDHVP